MKGNFFEQFRNYLLNEQEGRLKTFIPYYETAFQVKDEFNDLIIDCEKYHLEIDYEEDKTDGYTQGTFEFHLYEKDPNEDYGWQSKTNHCYKMMLSYDDRMWGYCECTFDMKGYNPIHDCCGNGCDWSAPAINLIKIEGITYHSFKGVERDLWELESKWSDDKIDHEEELRKANLKLLEEEIKYLEEQKQKYIK